MGGARGKSMRFEPVNVAGIDTRVWQGDGSSSDAEGVLFTLRGEVQKARGIARLVSWSGGDSAFVSDGAWSLFAHHHHDSTDVVISYGTQVAYLAGNALVDILTDRDDAKSPRGGARFCQAGDKLLIFDGLNRNMKWDGHRATELGIKIPPPPVTAYLIDAAVAAELFSDHAIVCDSSVVRSYTYSQTYINDAGQESEPSAAATVTDDDAADTTLYNLLVVSECDPEQSDIIARNVYRSADGGIAWNLVRRMEGVRGRHWYDYYAVGSEPSIIARPPVGQNAAPPVAKGAFVFRGRTYYWGVSDTPSVLYYSETNAPEAVPTQNILDVTSQDGDSLVGGVLAQDYALVFKRRSIYLLTHDRTEQPILSPLSAGIGAVADRAIVQFDGKLYFLSERGFFVTDGSQVRPLSRDLNDFVSLLPPAYLEDAFGWADTLNRRIFLSVNAGPGAVNNEVWAIHVDTGAITRLHNFVLGAALPYKGETVVAFRSVSGNVEKWELGLWDADTNIRDTAYTGEWETRWLDMKSPGSDKRFSHVIVYYVQEGSHSLTVKWSVSWDDTVSRGNTTLAMAASDATLWGSGNWDAATRLWDSQRLRSARVDISDTSEASVIGKSLRLSFSTTAVDTPFRIAGFEVFYEDHGERQDGTDATF